MLMKIFVFRVEKCSQMEKIILPKFTAKRIICLSLRNELYHCPSLPIPNLGKRPISNALNQSLIIFITRCSGGGSHKKFPVQWHKHLCESTVISGIYDNSSSQGKMKLIETNSVLYINAIWIHCQLQSDRENEAVLNNTTVSQFYVFFNFLYGNLFFIKELLEKNVEKVDSFHIYILSGTWKWTNCKSMPKKKLVKSFRKLIFPRAKDKLRRKVLPW